MSEERIVKRSLTSTIPNKTDWRRVDALTDEEIERAIDDDPDAAPRLDASWFARARIVMPPAKELISIRVDKDVLDFFRAIGPGYQTRINAVLRAFVEHEAPRQVVAKRPPVRTAVARQDSSAKTMSSPKKRAAANAMRAISKGKGGTKRAVRR
jgi:uncharacterized protein (DUF4415 family)